MLKDKIILITGSSRGIGLSVAEKCLSENAIVIANYRNESLGINKLLEKYGDERIIAIKADISISREVEFMTKKIKEKFSSIDGVVNNAGIISRTPDWKDIPMEDWEKIMSTNFFGTWNMIRYGIELMKNGGSIVNISSIYGAFPEANVLPYSISKAAINALTQAIAKEISPSVRINSIMPGNTLTNMVPSDNEIKAIEDKTLLKRSANASEIANAVVYLLSDASSYMTGCLIPIDGGYHLI